MRGHCYDALVGLAGCDKSLPGMMMAMVRLNVPSVFIYGGSILPGSYRGRQITVQDVFEAVGQHSVGKMSDAELLGDRAGGVPVGRLLRRPVHRQHHGHGRRGDRPGAALFLRRAGALRDARPLQLRLRREGDGADRQEHPAARHRHAARRWRMPRRSSRRPAARPTARCICRRSRTRPASSSTCSTSPRSSSARPTSPT